MKPEPTPTPDGKRSPQPRGFAHDLRSEDVLEKDLWDLDESESTDKEQHTTSKDSETSDPEATIDSERSTSTNIPVAPRSTRKDLVFQQNLVKNKTFQPKAKISPDDSTAPEVDKMEGFSNRVAASSTSDATFNELEDSLADTEATAKANIDEEDSPPALPSEQARPRARSSPEGSSSGSTVPATKPARGISKMEKLGLAAFLVILLGGICFFFLNSFSQLPATQKILSPSDLPIRGQKISADKIRSYWREPDPGKGETARRGTILIPVVELDVSGSPGAIRVFFRNSEKATVGDAVTRTVNGKSTLTIPATAGFDDAGLFAAYRTGETEAWTIEVFEGASENAAGSTFKKLFEMPISTQRR